MSKNIIIDNKAESPDNQSFVPIDIHKGLMEFDNNVEFFKGLIEEFIEHIEKKMIVMGKAVVDNNHDILRREAHAIKGGAANVSANRLSKKAYELEQSCKTGSQKEIALSVDKIRDAFFSLKGYVQNHGSLKL